MKEFIKLIKSNGWEVLEDNTDFRKQDSVLWRGYDGCNKSVFRIKKDALEISIIAIGDIYITTKNKQFSYRHDRDNGELTYYLRNHGDWINNNWFEVTDNRESYDFNPISYYLSDALDDLMEAIK